VIFLAVPIIVYSQFRAADEAAEALLLQNVREQGRVMTQALLPYLTSADKPSFPELGDQLQRFAGDATRLKLIYQPSGQSAFYYVASWPKVSASQLDREREELTQEHILDQLGTTCEVDLPFVLRYTTPGGEDEIVTSVTPVKAASGCWAVVTSFAGGSFPDSHLGQPYWTTPQVRIAAVIYLVMAVVTLTTIWSVRRGLRRFAERARAIRERRPGVSFAAEKEVPELADSLDLPLAEVDSLPEEVFDRP